MAEISSDLRKASSSHCDESLPMTSSLRYEPVEGERLEFEPEIYGSDDTTQIFGDDSRIPIGLREILVDPRLNPSKRIFCCGAASSLIVILSVVFLFIIGGYFHVQSEIKERAVIAKNGLDLLPKPKSDGAWIMFLNFKTEADKYVNALKNATEEYEKEQNSRVNLTRDCKPDERPNEKMSKWCRFPLKKKFMRAGKGCSFDDNKFGYSSQSPCVLISLRDTIGWAPVFSNNSRAKNDIPLKCVVLDTFKFYDEHINISYYPAHDLNANYGAFSLNKLPSLAIKTADGSEICDENGETLNDMASLLFVKFHLPPGFKHGLVHCTLVNNLEGAAITNFNTFKGTTELRFDIVA